MLKIGLTGGIGSGKTLVSQAFSIFGIPTYSSDDRAKWLMNNDENLIQDIKNEFGDQIYHPDGKLNRKALAKRVFNDTTRLQKLNSLVHPAVFNDNALWFKHHSTYPFVLKEAAILIESGAYKGVDKIIVVDAPIDARINRVMKRDGISAEMVKNRINNQISQSARLSFADFVINNDNKQSLMSQCFSIYQELSLESNT